MAGEPQGKEPTWLELNGIEVSEYPSAGLSIGKTLIYRKSGPEILESLGWNLTDFDVLVRFHNIGCELFMAHNRQETWFLDGSQMERLHPYPEVYNRVSRVAHTIQELRPGRVRVFFAGIGEAKILNSFHRLGHICYGCELNDGKLIRARKSLNEREHPWNS